jgi:hypothetical protein
MNNHTMNVIRGGKEYEVYQIPIWDIDQRDWFFKGTEEGVHLLAKLCTPVPAETPPEKAADNEVTKEAMRIQKLHSHNFYESDLDRDFDINDCVLPFERKYKRALRMWNDWHCYANSGHLVLQSKYYANDIVRPLLRKIKELTAEIDRLKSESWTEEDLWWVVDEAIDIYEGRGGWTRGATKELEDKLSARRAAKAKE